MINTGFIIYCIFVVLFCIIIYLINPNLMGFWNKKKRLKIMNMIKKHLPEEYSIEEISWFTSTKIKHEKNIWKVYIMIYNSKVKEIDRVDYWDRRTNGHCVFDLDSNKCSWRMN